MSNPAQKPPSAALEVLLAAADLDSQGFSEFTEWDLSVTTWKRNPNRFGCRGYEDKYPDHKRVMMEIMARTKVDNPVRKGWIEKIRPNIYRLTALGRAAASDAIGAGVQVTESNPASQHWYQAVRPLVESSAFRRHKSDAAEPRIWAGAAAFYGLRRSDAGHLVDRLEATARAIVGALNWMDTHNLNEIRMGVSAGGKAISRKEIQDLAEFDDCLRERFGRQIEAIRKRN